MEPIIKTIDLDVYYNLGKSNEYYALRRVNIEIYEGEYIVLFGPSGCGKSTLLYVLLGALPPTAGDFLVKGDNPYKYDWRRLVEYQQKTIGIIFQAFNLIPSLSVADNVSLPQIFGNLPPSVRMQRTETLLKRFGIWEQAKKLPMTLSGGQQQRVAVARSLIYDPEILLADEPVGNLDTLNAEKVMKTLEEINQVDKKTIILVTHDPSYLPYAHRIYYLRDGRVEREVANPEKPQIKKTGAQIMAVTEIEKLAKSYPYLSPHGLKVKSIVNFITQDLTIDQLMRLEKLVAAVIDGKIDKEDFSRGLSTPFLEGGVGLARPAAEKMVEKTMKVLEASKDVARFRRHAEEVYYPGQKTFVERLRTAILDEYEGQVSLAQLRRLEEAIGKRVTGKISEEDFRSFLDTDMEKGGMGFNSRTARNLSLVLEKILAQGIIQN